MIYAKFCAMGYPAHRSRNAIKPETLCRWWRDWRRDAAVDPSSIVSSPVYDTGSNKVVGRITAMGTYQPNAP